MFIHDTNPYSYLTSTEQIFFSRTLKYNIKECVYNVPPVISSVEDICCSALKGHIVLASVTQSIWTTWLCIRINSHCCLFFFFQMKYCIIPDVLLHLGQVFSHIHSQSSGWPEWQGEQWSNVNAVVYDWLDNLSKNWSSHYAFESTNVMLFFQRELSLLDRLVLFSCQRE